MDLKFPLTAIVITLLLAAPALSQVSASARPYYTVESQTSRAMVVSFDFGQLSIREVGDATPSAKIFEIPGLSSNYENGRPLLPVLALPLTLPEGRVSAAIRVEKTETYPGYYPLLFNDRPNNPEVEQARAGEFRRAAAAEARAFRSLYPEQIFELENLGLFRDYQLSALRVYPVQATGSGVTFYRKFTVTLSFSDSAPPAEAVPFSEAELLKKFVANKEQISLISPQTAQSSANYGTASSPVFSPGSTDTRVKIIVDRKGIYQVTGRDLQDARVDISAIDPAAFRLSNKGRDVAFFLTGGQDNSFDPDDYLEFWGERNEKTFLAQYPDQYADPFSDENVYWLDWGGSGGLRMVEENGSLITTTQVNPSLFYSATVHVEEDRQFMRLGEGSPEQLSYQRDLWFFDAGVKAVGKKEYPFQLLYPYEPSFRPVYVTVMFSGLSFGYHDVMVWLNNGFVGASPPNSWYSQDTARISNRSNSSLRPGDLQHGENVLEVQLPSLSSSSTDIVLLNWFEVTYDRYFRAHHNEIEFTRPALVLYPGTDLFQFDIDNFRRPDVEIYKKGISKIVNFRIDVETINDTNLYKISFQDNVPSGDIEYVALTPDRKKKPLRIEKDLPFDPEAPFRTLKDASNAAEYVIITHSRFYENGLELRDYRRGQGVATELIDVQDVYDEFNYGIKSPLAIQEFLRYAFFNWQRTPRLKYVLLLGDANSNYKSKSATAMDFVPTFFYQTQEFGAAATDYPYALISGNDEIPDLFVGRIPVNTNNEVNISVAKIKEFEQTAPVNAWRNRALFIAGKDDGTYELQNPANPAFRTQNTRIIEAILPRYISGNRLNSVKDPNLPFDPNFGSSSDLRDYFDEGMFWVNFMGHGGGGIWADEGLMQLPDVDRLNNKGMYPFVTSMTCFTGGFENPARPGLAEKLLLAPDKGAIGVLGSSGLGYLHNDFSMLWYIGQFLFDRSMSVGEMTTIGRILYWNSQGRYGNVPGQSTPGFEGVKREMVYQYNLLGDPYLKLHYAPSALGVEPHTVTPQRGDTLQVAISTPLFAADGYLELADGKFNLVDRIPLFGVSQNAVAPVIIPQSFPDGTGLIRVYLSDGSQDGSGQAAIGVNYAALSSVEIQPPDPRVDDTVYVNLRVQDVHGIRRVYLFRDAGLDTIFAVRDLADTTRFTAKMKPTFQVQTVPYEVHVENRVGNISIFRGLSYVVTDTRPDIALVPGSLQFTGQKKAQVKVGVTNVAGAGEDDRVKVNVFLAEEQRNGQVGSFFASGAVALSSNDSASVHIDFPLSLNRPEFRLYAYAEVDSAEDVADFKPENNSLRQLLTPTIFNVTPAGSDTITAGAYRVYFPPGSVSDSSAVRLELQTFAKPQDQIGLLPVSTLAQGEYHALSVSLLNPAVTQNAPFQLVASLDPALVDTSQYPVEEITLYEKVNSSQPWTSTLFAGDATNLRLEAYLQKNGVYAPFISTDANAPRIELTVDGRPVLQSGLVSPKPSLYVIVQDESGINLQKDKISITLNGAALPEDKVLIPDSVQKNNVLGITANPELGQGRHRLSVGVQDVNGNSTQKEFELVVNEDFDIIVYGNYPNPFDKQTIFAYFVNLNDDLDEFEIRIYTVSGRLIRRIDSDINNGINDPDGGAKRKGYNELIWDGRDQEGNEVANGVYFAQIRGTYQGETKEKILKVARLR